MSSQFEIIVFRKYNECLRWLLPLQNHCIIFNKGLPLEDDIQYAFRNIIEVPSDIGADHTYAFLSYMVSEYDHILEKKNQSDKMKSKEIKTIVFIKANISQDIPPEYRNGAETLYVRLLIVQASFYGLSLNLHHDTYAYESKKYIDQKSNIQGSQYFFGEWYRKYIDPKRISLLIYNDDIKWYHEKCFAIREEKLLLHPKSYYLDLLSQLQIPEKNESELFLERSWYHIFDQK